jgi:hypothetical protein
MPTPAMCLIFGEVIGAGGRLAGTDFLAAEDRGFGITNLLSNFGQHREYAK